VGESSVNLSHSLASASSQQYFDAAVAGDTPRRSDFGYDVYAHVTKTVDGTDEGDDDSFEFTQEQTLFLGAGVHAQPPSTL